MNNLASELESPAENDPAPPTTETAPPKPRVLIVEDDQIARMVLASIVRSTGLVGAIDSARSLDEARACLERFRYGLVIADYLLEGPGTGLDLWRDFPLRNTPTKFILTSGLQHDRLKILRREAFPCFLRKPFLVGQCRQTVETQLRFAA